MKKYTVHSHLILLFLWNLPGSSTSCGRKHLDIMQPSILLGKESGPKKSRIVPVLFSNNEFLPLHQYHVIMHI